MSESITILVNRPSIFWLPSKRGPKNSDGIRPAICGKLLLRPGSNTIRRKRWDMTKDHPAIVKHVELGTLVVNPTAAEKVARTHTPDRLTGLKDMTIAKAAPYIEACTDGAQLEKWRNGDSRAGIHAAIDARLTVLEESGEEPPAPDPLGDEDFS